MWRRLAVITGLSAAALVGPVLDVYGQNPEVFVANRSNATEIVAFGLIVALIVPLLSWGILALAGLIGERASQIAYKLIVAVLALGIGLIVSRQVLPESTVPAFLTTLAIAGLVFWLAQTIDVIFVFAAAAIPVLLVMFLGTSATSRLIWGEPQLVDAATDVGSPHHVVMLQLDEMPLASIMNTDGTINGDLYPNLARLADEGTWYRNAFSTSIATTQSVPAILTGNRGETGESPSYVDHPDNLFTLLGDSYDMHVIEWVAELCPEETCPDYAGRAPARFSNLLKDVGVVYGHLTLPATWRESLPSIDNAWKGFLGQDEYPEGTGVEIEGLPVPAEGERSEWVDWIQRLINGIDSDNPPTLSYAHLRAPHVPWVSNPSGTQYERPEEYTEVEGVEGDGHWSADPAPAVIGFQRHLYQIGFFDVMLGRLIDRLEDTETWDDTMLIILADHGASFVPGEHRRWPYEDNRDDLYRVPMFIKYPGQAVGEVVDLPAFGIDVLPTIVDVLDIDTDWEFEGESLVDLDVSRPHEPQRWCCNGEGASTDLQVLFDQVERNYGWLPDQTSWVGVAGVGAHGDLVGTPVTDLDVAGDDGFSWSLGLGETLDEVDRDTGMVQTLVTGRIESGNDLVVDEMLVVVNDVVAGVAHLVRDSVGGATFYGLLAEELVADGGNDVELLLPDGTGEWLAGRPEDLTVALIADDGHELELGAEGAKRIQVDSVIASDAGWELTGWAADVTNKAVPETFYVFAGDRLIYSGPPNVENGNVVRWFESDNLLHSGFEVEVAAADVPAGVTRLTVVAEFGDGAIADPANLPG